MHKVHVSGSEIKELIQKVNAKKVIPIHTEHAEVFKEFSENMEIVSVKINCLFKKNKRKFFEKLYRFL